MKCIILFENNIISKSLLTNEGKTVWNPLYTLLSVPLMFEDPFIDF